MGVQPTGHWIHTGHRSHRTGGDGTGRSRLTAGRWAPRNPPPHPPRRGSRIALWPPEGALGSQLPPPSPCLASTASPHTPLPHLPPAQVQGISPSPASRSSALPAPSRRGPALPPARTFRIGEGACVSPRCTPLPGWLSPGRGAVDAGDPPCHRSVPLRGWARAEPQRAARARLQGSGVSVFRGKKGK